MIPDKIYVGVGTLSSIQPAEEYAFPGWQEKPYSQIRNEEYIRKEVVEHIIRSALGPQDAFNKLRSL
jgi:hypothetical protein